MYDRLSFYHRHVSRLTAVIAAVFSALLAAPAGAAPIALAVELGTPLIRAGQAQTVFLKVGLTGLDAGSEFDRAPANIAIVLDRSGSMRGAKIARARDAAIMAIDRLNGDDIAAVISYDSTVRVDVPAIYVHDKDAIRTRIERIGAGGKTALFAGVSKGAGEVQKYLDPNRVNRIILLSDGIANVGPNSPAALGRLGASLSEDGITVSTIGLGLDYNEDLMSKLAGMSDGNHTFAESAADLARIFDTEFADVLSVVGQDVEITIHCAQGIRPVRVLGRSAQIDGREVRLTLNQIYSEQEKFIILELDVPAGEPGTSRAIASVEANYLNTLTRRRERLAGLSQISFSESAQEIAAEANEVVIVDMAEQVANQMSKDAVVLRDQGLIEEASGKLEASARYLDSYGRRYNAPDLHQLSEQFKRDAEQLGDERDWTKLRKTLKQKQHAVENQQRN